MSRMRAIFLKFASLAGYAPRSMFLIVLALSIPSLCAPAMASEADCPNLVLGSSSFEGIYDGTDCGDFCHIAIIGDSGQERSFLAGRPIDMEFDSNDEITALVYKNARIKKGDRVAVKYNTEQFWTIEPEGCAKDAEIVMEIAVIK